MSGKTSNESKYKYAAKTYDRVSVWTRKDTLSKGDIQEAADLAGMSFNAFCAEALLEKIQKTKPAQSNLDII